MEVLLYLALALVAAAPVAFAGRMMATSPRNSTGSVVLEDMTRGFDA